MAYRPRHIRFGGGKYGEQQVHTLFGFGRRVGSKDEGAKGCLDSK
jgi:hypothetical protein